MGRGVPICSPIKKILFKFNYLFLLHSPACLSPDVVDIEEESEDKKSNNSSDSNRQIPPTGIPHEFKLRLTPNEWEKIMPEPDTNKLKSGWTNTLALKLNEKNPYCTIKFKYHHVRKTGGRKKKGHFFVAKSSCKFENCSSYIFTIKKQPPETLQKNVKVYVKRLGKIQHSKRSVKKRHTRRPQRKQIARDLKAESISSWYYKAYANMDDEAKMGGNISMPRTQMVLRKIKSEQLLEGNVHMDMLQEIKILNDVYRDLETDGFIRFFAVQPFQVHMYLHEQLMAFIKANKNHSGVLYFDATGSLVQKIPGQNQRIFLYALVMENPIEGRSVLPVGEFLSNDHHSSEIKHFLGFLCNNLKKLTTKFIPRRIETDLSWAMIQGVTQTFNEQNVKAYLDFVWGVLNRKVGIKEIKSKCYPHVCSAHMIQIFIRTLELKNIDKGLKDFTIRCLCCLLNSTSLSKAKQTFSLMCDVFLPKGQNKHMKKGLKALTELIRQSKDFDMDLDAVEEEELETLKELEEENSDNFALLKNSPFYR